MISEDQADQQRGKGAAAAAAKQVSRTVVVVVVVRELAAAESSAELTPGASPTVQYSRTGRQTDRQTDQLRERTESTLSHSADLHMRLEGKKGKHLQQISLDFFPRRHNRAPSRTR